MAFKRFIPIQDTYIVSGSTELNFGADELLQLGKCSDSRASGSARILMKILPDSSELDFENYLSSSHKATLHLFLSEAHNLPVTYSIVGCTLPEQWSEGFGRNGDEPALVNGATWKYRNEYQEEWSESFGGDLGSIYDGKFAFSESIAEYIDGSGSVIATYSKPSTDGGNAWGWISGLEGTERIWAWQRYDRDTDKDLNLDVTDLVDSWILSGSINNGLIFRFGDETLANTLGTSLSFYSTDTHTIYRPYLELKWNDTVYSSSLAEGVLPFSVGVENFHRDYRVDDRVKFRLNVTQLYPSRIYSTSSIYRQEDYVLPENSYWGIKNEYTNEMVIDFDEIGSKISADSTGSYFFLDMNNLEPERYYRLLVQVQKDGEKITIDNRNIFKVMRYGRN